MEMTIILNKEREVKSMLADIVRSNMNVKNQNLRTKASKFSKLFQSDPAVTIEKASIDDILEKCNLKNYIKKENTAPQITESVVADNKEAADSDYIVENPDEVIVPFPIVSNINLEEKLPFFKSLSLKLASL